MEARDRPSPPGSSPRLRGTVQLHRRPDAELRFIPAPAGNGCSMACWAAASAVHPRACGERSVGSISANRASGSSPRLRGTVPDYLPYINGVRFIPAPAGNGVKSLAIANSSAVHPRACGERNGRYVHGVDSFGSSPRLRGTVVDVDIRIPSVRFIPAPAGNGACRSLPAKRKSVHPRACGERFSHRRTVGVTVGSSPRLRGTG